MHTFSSGDFKDLTIEQAMLRDAPHLYDLMRWARDKSIPGLRNALRDFDILRGKLHKVAITATCAEPGCEAIASSMTLPIDKEGWYRPAPYWWCDKHEPFHRSGISPKYPIHFDAMERLKTKGEKELLFSTLRRVFGMKRGARITAAFAQQFFAKLN